MFDVITIGDATKDIFINPCHDHFCRDQIGMSGDKLFIRHGDKISVDQIHQSLGGSAANVAVGLARLGLKTAIISALGQDEVGEEIKTKLIDENVDTSKLLIKNKMTSSTSVIIVFSKERTVFVYRGLKNYSQLKISAKFSTKWVYLGPVANEFSVHYNQLISLVSQKNLNLVVNPGHRQIQQGLDNLLRLLRVTKILILNKQEALDLSSLPVFTDLKRILQVLTNYGPKIVVITDGKEGAYLTCDDKYYHMKIFPADVIDPTGAGDAFSSGFLAAYIKGEDLETAAKWGITNSAQVIEKYGSQTNLQTQSKLEKLASCALPLYKL